MKLNSISGNVSSLFAELLRQCKRILERIGSSRRKVVIVFFAFLVLLTPVIVLYLVQINLDTRSKANYDTPERIVYGNVGVDSFTVAWVTPNKSAVGYIQWGDSQQTVGQIALDDRDTAGTQNRITHVATVKNLQPDKTYYFRIVSGISIYPADGTLLTFKTMSVAAQAVPGVVSIYGDVSNITGDDAIVYLAPSGQESNVYPLITFVTNERTWFHNAAGFTKKSDASAVINTVNNDLTVLVEGGTGGVQLTKKASQSPISVEMNATPITESPIFGTKLAQVEDKNPVTVVPTKKITPSQNNSAQPTPTIPEPKKSALSKFIDFFKIRQDVDLRHPNGQIIPSVSINDTLYKTLLENELVTNITENAFTVMWASSAPVNGVVYYGTDSAVPGSVQKDDRNELQSNFYRLHMVTIKSLSPGTKYYYRKSPTSIPSSISMPATLTSPPSFSNITGNLVNFSGECAVISQVERGDEKSTSISTATSDIGTWNINLGTMRNSQLSVYFSPKGTDIVSFEAICITSEGSVLRGTKSAIVESVLGDPEVTIQMTQK